jgi:hypothetical protein
MEKEATQLRTIPIYKPGFSTGAILNINHIDLINLIKGFLAKIN